MWNSRWFYCLTLFTHYLQRSLKRYEIGDLLDSLTETKFSMSFLHLWKFELKMGTFVSIQGAQGRPRTTISSRSSHRADPSTLHQRLQVISAFHLARMETCIQVSKTLPSSVPSFIQFWRCLEHEICLSSDHSTSIVFAPFFTSESIFVAYHTRDIPCSICMAWCFSACNRMVNKHDSAPNIKTGQMKKQTQNAFPTFLRRFLTSSPVTTWETRIQFLGEALVFLFSLAYALGLQQPWQVLPS